MIQTPLGADGYPTLKITQGQFIAKTDKYLNPEICRKGKKISLAGVITNVREKELGFTKIPYPEIKIMQSTYGKIRMEGFFRRKGENND